MASPKGTNPANSEDGKTRAVEASIVWTAVRRLQTNGPGWRKRRCRVRKIASPSQCRPENRAAAR
jgi:hypothetical protein